MANDGMRFTNFYVSQAVCSASRASLSKGTTELALYDLENDIGERNNVAEKYPQIVQRLKALAQIIREELGDSLTKHEGKEIRPAGRRPD